tara:strand:- start:532 stop:636 length:105 start_codon:yes stop_codon:yes gene_type:complete
MSNFLTVMPLPLVIPKGWGAKRVAMGVYEVSRPN